MIGRDVVVEAEIIEQPRPRSLKAIIAVSPANQRDSMDHDTALTTINERLFQRYLRKRGSVSGVAGVGVK
jgi:hypothetical protein